MNFNKLNSFIKIVNAKDIDRNEFLYDPITTKLSKDLDDTFEDDNFENDNIILSESHISRLESIIKLAGLFEDQYLVKIAFVETPIPHTHPTTAAHHLENAHVHELNAKRRTESAKDARDIAAKHSAKHLGKEQTHHENIASEHEKEAAKHESDAQESRDKALELANKDLENAKDNSKPVDYDYIKEHYFNNDGTPKDIIAGTIAETNFEEYKKHNEEIRKKPKSTQISGANPKSGDTKLTPKELEELNKKEAELGLAKEAFDSDFLYFKNGYKSTEVYERVEALKGFQKKYFNGSQPNKLGKSLGLKPLETYKKDIKLESLDDKIRSLATKTVQERQKSSYLREQIENFRDSLFDGDLPNYEGTKYGLTNLEEFDNRYGSGKNNKLDPKKLLSDAIGKRLSKPTIGYVERIKLNVQAVRLGNNILLKLFTQPTLLAILGGIGVSAFLFGKKSVKKIKTDPQPGTDPSHLEEAKKAADDLHNVALAADGNQIEEIINQINVVILTMNDMKETVEETHKKHIEDVIQSLDATVKYFESVKGTEYDPTDATSNKNLQEVKAKIKETCEKWISHIPALSKSIRDELQHPEVSDQFDELQKLFEITEKAISTIGK